jgi:FAD/FMN-containing dehydrogenase
MSRFREPFRGELVEPNDPGYDRARVVWNGTIDRRPAIVARCTGVDDVASAIRFAREQDLVIAVRAGGHSVGGFSTCDDGLLLDLSGFHGVEIDAEAGVARVDGGALLRELDAAAQEFGLVCPVGNVSHTGVAGLTLGGGMGRLQRRYGYTIDNLLAVDLVTAEGESIRVSEEENPDLFWGIRGAGANFGVVTSFEFRLHPMGTMVTQGFILYAPDRAHEVAEAFLRCASSAPRELMPTMLFGIVGPDDPWPDLVGRPVALLQAVHSGSDEAAERDLRALRLKDPLAGDFERKSYLSVQALADDVLAWGKRFYMKGGFVDTITPELVDLCMDHMARAPGECSIGFWSQGGAIADVPPEATAFAGRDASFWVGVESFWDDGSRDEAMVEWGRTTWDALDPFTAAGHYVNDVIETGDDVVRSIYGARAYERLVGLKRTYDPANVFRRNQNIRP